MKFTERGTTMFYKDDSQRVDPPEDVEVFEEPITHLDICEYLSDPDNLWEAICIDGVAEPYPRGRGFYYQRQNQLQHERVHEAIHMAIEQQDFKALGIIVFDQCTEYARKQIKISQ